MTEKSIKAFAPATVGNAITGFDVLGFALDHPGDEVVLKLSPTPGIKITKITGDYGKLPLDPTKNTAGVALLEFLKIINSRQGFEIEIHKNLPLGSGLGSSAATAVASVFAANELLDAKLSKAELLPCTMQAEFAACGSAHADNVAPALFGGFVLIRSYQPLDIIHFVPPAELFCTLLHPNIVINTADARKILSPTVPLKDYVIQSGNLAGLISGIMRHDYELIGRSLTDVIIEPQRCKLIPGFQQAKTAALTGGALGFGISGSGPALVAICRGESTATKIAAALSQVFTTLAIKHQVFISKISTIGPKILS